MKRSPITTLFLTALCAAWLLAAPLANGANFVNLALNQWDDKLFPLTEYGLEVKVVIPDVTGVTGVEMTLGNGTTVLTLADVGSGTWTPDEESFTSLVNTQSALDGTWEINIMGSNPSKTEFTFSTPTMGYFAPPAVTNPTHGDPNVPQNVTFMWDKPSGVGASDFLFVFVLDVNIEQEDANVLGGSLSINDTQWTPLPLAGGFSEFDVFYVTPTNGQVGAFNVTMNPGNISWSDSPLDLSLSPIIDPALGIGGWSTIGFTVVPEPSSYGLALLSAVGLVWHGHRSRRGEGGFGIADCGFGNAEC